MYVQYVSAVWERIRTSAFLPELPVAWFCLLLVGWWINTFHFLPTWCLFHFLFCVCLTLSSGQGKHGYFECLNMWIFFWGSLNESTRKLSNVRCLPYNRTHCSWLTYSPVISLNCLRDKGVVVSCCHYYYGSLWQLHTLRRVVWFSLAAKPSVGNQMLLPHWRKLHTEHTTMAPYCGDGFVGDVSGVLAQVPAAMLAHHCSRNPE